MIAIAIISLVIGIFIIISAILSWISLSRISDLEAEVRKLKSIVNGDSKVGLSKSEIVEQPKSLAKDKSAEFKKVSTDQEKHNISELAKNNQKREKKEKASNFELNFGTKLPVWIGGIALAFAGFYLVKHSIDTGILNPTNRIILGILFGLTLVISSLKVMAKKNIANAIRISQSLAGSGIIMLYISIYAATEMYNFLGPLMGFSAMAGITFATIFLSLRNGLPIALMGLVGGFLTPILISSENPSSITLFSYLFILFYGLTTVAERKNWWIITSGSVLAIISMLLIWIFGRYFVPFDSVILGFFIIAVSLTLVIKGQRAIESEPKGLWNFGILKLTNYLALSISAILMGLMISKSDFSLYSWLMYGIMTIGGLFLAKYKERDYSFISWILLAVNLTLLFLSNMPYEFYIITIIISSIIFIGLSYYFMFRSENPINWVGIISVSAPLFYILAYIKLKHIESGIEMFWGYLGFAVAGLGIFSLKAILEKTIEGRARDYISGIFAASITAIITIALAIEVHENFLPIAIAGEIFAISLINLKVNIKYLKYLTLVLAGFFALLLIPQILLLIQLSFYSLLEMRINLQGSLPLVNQPLIQLGIPAALFAGSCMLLSKIKYDRIVYIFEIISVALIGTMGYYLARNIMHPDLKVIFIKAGFFERGVITNIFFIFGLICFFIGRRYCRQALSYCGVVLSIIAIFRLGYFDLLVHNPLWARRQEVGEGIIFNSLLITYFLPIFWSLIAAKEFRNLSKFKFEKVANLTGLILFLALVTLQVRQYFQGSILTSGIASTAEIYSYSVIWILSGIVLLSLGFVRNNRMLRISSLIVMIISVAKVFLYDASELEGILRVLSFFGLGVSLIGLSYFYTKFVFSENKVKAGS
jgi:uncharacterized membrane protein